MRAWDNAFIYGLIKTASKSGTDIVSGINNGVKYRIMFRHDISPTGRIITQHRQGDIYAKTSGTADSFQKVGYVAEGSVYLM